MTRAQAPCFRDRGRCRGAGAERDRRLEALAAPRKRRARVDRRRAQELEGTVGSSAIWVSDHLRLDRPKELEGRNLVWSAPACRWISRSSARRSVGDSDRVRDRAGIRGRQGSHRGGDRDDGKSTTVELLGAIAGRRPEDGGAGNIGVALSRRPRRSPRTGFLVVEISSFQLESCTRFHPKVGVLLNVTPDHLDRHGSMNATRAQGEALRVSEGGRIPGAASG